MKINITVFITLIRFNSQSPTKGTAILSAIRWTIHRMFQFSVPNKGDCNLKLLILLRYVILVSILSPQQRGLQYDDRWYSYS